MGFFSKVPTVLSPRAEGRQGTPPEWDEFWYQPFGWASNVPGGVPISPEFAMTLSHVQCAVQTISDDFGTMTCQLFSDDGKDGHARVRYADPGIGGLAYRLRWQPNLWQTAKAFWSTMAWQFLLRPACYAEIRYRQSSDSIIDQLIPRHPDRVLQQVLPSGRLRFKLTEPAGHPPRYLTQDEMFFVQNTSTDGLNAISRVGFGGKVISTGIALQDFTRNYFKKGATAALLGTYKGGEMEESEEASLHARISRYVAGTENAGGFLLVPEDITVSGLGVDPEKAQLLGLKDLSGRDVARMFKMPPHKLGIAGAAAYASQVQSAQEYASGTQMPIVVEMEQAIYIHLIVARDYFAKFNMDMLVRADLKTRMEAYEIAIRSRVMRPSEARVKEDMSPDPALDTLSESDYRPGTSDSRKNGAANGGSGQAASAHPVKALLAVHDNAIRCLRRERAAVEKLAKKYASDVDGWKSGLRDFYADHGSFVAQVMRLHPEVARAYAAQHGAEFEAHGMARLEGESGAMWERFEADELTTLALDAGDRTVDAWFTRRLVDPRSPAPVHVSVPVSTPVTIEKGAIEVDARPQVDVRPATVKVQNIQTPAGTEYRRGDRGASGRGVVMA